MATGFYATSKPTNIHAMCSLREDQMPLAGDFRPYFTIHDKDHAALVNQNAPQAGLLLGVTNPFYDGACKHWPHQLSLGDSSQCVFSTGKECPPPSDSRQCTGRDTPRWGTILLSLVLSPAGRPRHISVTYRRTGACSRLSSKQRPNQIRKRVGHEVHLESRFFIEKISQKKSKPSPSGVILPLAPPHFSYR